MTRKLIAVRLWMLLCAAGIPSSAWALAANDFVDYSLRNGRNKVLLPGRLYVPPESQIPDAAPRPLIVYLAGSGGNGTDNSTQLLFIGDVMRNEAVQRGAFIYAPQTASSWSTTTVTSEVMTMIDRAIDTLHADTNRVYIVGYSLGSYGTWTMLSRYDGRFAAAVPISGGSPASDFVPARLIDTPIFAFHARDDDAAPVTATRNIISNILAADGQPRPTFPAADPRDFLISNSNIPFHQELSAAVHQYADISEFFVSDPRMDLLYFEPATGGHISIQAALDAPEVYDWMFSHTTAVPEPSTIIVLGIAVCWRFAGRFERA
jgi:predicted peptidase